MKQVYLFIALLWLIATPYSTAQESTTNHSVEKANFDGKWRINFNCGYGLRIASSSSAQEALVQQGYDEESVQKFISSIKQGYKIEGQVHYMLWETTGIGLDYHYFHSSGNLSGYINTSDLYSYTRYSSISDNAFTNYIGGSFFSEQVIGKSRFKAIAQFSIGYCFYREEIMYDYSPLAITGGNLGINAQLGIRYPATPSLTVGITGGFFDSVISKFNADNGESTQTVKLKDDEREKLARIDLSLGICYYF